MPMIPELPAAMVRAAAAATAVAALSLWLCTEQVKRASKGCRHGSCWAPSPSGRAGALTCPAAGVRSHRRRVFSRLWRLLCRVAGWAPGQPRAQVSLHGGGCTPAGLLAAPRCPALPASATPPGCEPPRECNPCLWRVLVTCSAYKRGAKAVRLKEIVNEVGCRGLPRGHVWGIHCRSVLVRAVWGSGQGSAGCSTPRAC